MKKWPRFDLAFVLALVLLVAAPLTVVSTAGCGDRPVTIETEAGKRAYDTNEVLIRVERLQDAAIAAFDRGQVDLATSRAIVFATVQVNDLAEAAQTGWQAAALKAWDNAKKELTALRPGGQFALLAAAIDEVLKQP